ncbi:MAG: CRISPR-associated endonuclease Cas2 [Ktedonobacteraceae bacterium]
MKSASSPHLPSDSSAGEREYDIPDDRRRTRVHTLLTGFGTWVQYSVFECFLDRKQRMMLEARLLEEIHQREDTVRIYRLCGACLPKVEVLGHGELPRDEQVYIL